MRSSLFFAAALLGLCANAAQAQAPVTSADLAKAAQGRLVPFFTCLRENQIGVVSAHRGGHAPGFPENALSTNRHTVGLVPVFLEGDVQVTKDGVLVLNHDDTLDRTSTGKGKISDQTWAELKSVRLKDTQGKVTDQGLALFSDWLAFGKDKAILQVDLKPTTGDEKVVAAVRAAGAEDRVVYVTYTQEQARHVLSLSPKTLVSLPVRNRAEFESHKAAGLMGPNVIAMLLPVKDDPALYGDVAATGAPIADLGAMWGPDSADARWTSAKDDELYLSRQTEFHAQIVPSDHALRAGAAFQASPDYRKRLAVCGVGS